jgi:hypothetical protein
MRKRTLHLLFLVDIEEILPILASDVGSGKLFRRSCLKLAPLTSRLYHI